MKKQQMQIFAALSLTFIFSCAGVGRAQWARTVTKAARDSCSNSVTTDGTGNVYVTGYQSSNGVIVKYR